MPHSDVPLIVAGYPDLRRTRRPVIFVEHGSGEHYGMGDPHYAGGKGRERVILFLSPNRRVHEANESRYPGRSVIVGSPRLEWLRKRVAKGTRGKDGHPLRVAVSFHWDCRLHPHTRTALPHYQPWFGSWAADSRIEVRGHAHPRIADQAARLFAQAGIEFIDHYEDVVDWANVYAVDNSSTLWESVALGLPVVVLDAPWYTPINSGFRFWKFADVGPRIQSGEQLADAALSANHNRVSYDPIRHQAVAEIFGAVEGATMKAVQAIEATINAQSGTPSPDTRPVTT